MIDRVTRWKATQEQIKSNLGDLPSYENLREWLKKKIAVTHGSTSLNALDALLAILDLSAVVVTEADETTEGKLYYWLC
jgi:hypothetical protein